MKTALQIFLALALLTLGAFVGWHARPDCPAIEARVDTLVIRDTIRDTVLVPRTIREIRVDTVLVELADDTIYVDALIPIERKVYATADYRAEIEGFRPALVSMEVYRQTQFIDRTQTIRVPDPRRWGIGVTAGYGVMVRDGRLIGAPFIGVGLQYNLVKW
jgi:hypothetical protein